MAPEKKDSFIDYLAELPNFFSMFLIPIYFTTASAMLLEMSAYLKVSVANLNLIFTFFTLGMLIGQLTSVIYNRRFKSVKIVVGAYSLIIIFLIILRFSSNFLVFFAFYLIIGYLSGVIQIQSTKYILENAIKNKDRVMTIFLSTYPIGILIAPFIASALIKNNIDWRMSYIIMAVLSVIAIVLYITMKGRKSSLVKEEAEKIPIKKIFYDKKRNVVFLLGLLILLFFCIAETVISTWSPTFLRSERMFDIKYAGYAIAIYIISVLIGRTILAAFAGKYRSNIMLMFLSVFSLIALLCFTFFKSTYATFISVFFIGLGFSGIITIGVSASGTVYEKGRGVLASIIFSVINFGILLAPLLAGQVSKFNMTLSVALSPIFILILIIVIIIKMIYEKKKKNDDFRGKF
jgi:predicted MFS family arabinose efflux permease